MPEPHWEIPPHDVTALRPKASGVCVIVPVIDEGERLTAQLVRMRAASDVDIVVADGGSTDGSTDPERLDGVSALLRMHDGPGLSAQLRMGFAFALDRGYTGVITVDGNGKDGVEAIPRFLAALQDGVDYAQGSRYIEGGEAVNTPWDRHLAVRLLHAPVLSAAAGHRFTDTTNGFRAFSARFLRDDRVRPFRSVFQTYNLHYYLTVRAAQLGFRVTEIPVRRAYPDRGRTPTKIGGVAGKARIVGQLLAAAAGRYDP